jgi:hypothetical protein
MKACICEDGTLIIDAENHTEAYAIKKWVADNKDKLPPCVLFGKDEKLLNQNDYYDKRQ